MNLEQTVEFIQLAHANQKDKAGRPYWLHPVAVSIITPGNMDEKIAALLHDVVEDTSYSIEDLKKMGYNDNVLEMVSLVTRTKESGTYKEWIMSLANSKNIGAIHVKISDNLHNSSPSRMANLEEDVRKGMTKRYFKARNILMKALINLSDPCVSYFVSYCKENKILFKSK